MNAYHIPVMGKESVEALQVHLGGTYVDVTFGGGGHSALIFERLGKGRLIGFDQDPDAEKNSEKFISDNNRNFLFVKSNFRYLTRFLRFHQVIPVDGILADLGVSSFQFDTSSRGFSIRFDGPLDMRMDPSNPIDAKHIINTFNERDLVHLFSYFGDIKNAKTLAAKILRERQKNEIHTTNQLIEILKGLSPKNKENKYAAQVFQSLRIQVNDELSALKDFLSQTTEALKKGGRLVVISYHSLEDRLVKDFMSSGNFDGKIEKDFFGNILRPFTPAIRKPFTPSVEEIVSNSRSRSAKLRIAIKN